MAPAISGFRRTVVTGSDTTDFESGAHIDLTATRKSLNRIFVITDTC